MQILWKKFEIPIHGICVFIKSDTIGIDWNEQIEIMPVQTNRCQNLQSEYDNLFHFVDVNGDTESRSPASFNAKNSDPLDLEIYDKL